MVIQAGAAQALIVHLEAQRFDQVQLAAGIGAQADDVAGVRRNLGLEQNDMEHDRAQGQG
ncbi:hypothetical protein D3C85_1911990 [compost metagenome]